MGGKGRSGKEIWGAGGDERGKEEWEVGVERIGRW